MAAVAVGFLFALASVAQDAKPAAAEPQWLTSFDAASAEAQKSGKPILAYFTVGDSDPWSGPWCWKLCREVFDQKEFKEWAAKNVVLFELDFPFRKAQDDATKKANADLAKKYKVEEFPTVIFMNPDGTQLGLTGYERGGPKPWIENAQKILDAKKRAKT